MDSVSSPKLRAGRGPQSTWYPYYAGYSEFFVRDVLANFDLSPGSTVLDPWVGTGTTTDIAARLGYSAVGIDLNPALAVIAFGRSLPPELYDALASAISSLMLGPKTARTIEERPIGQNDPLLEWFDLQSAGLVRAVERGIRSYDCQCQNTGCCSRIRSYSSKLRDICTLRASLYVCLFRVVNELTQSFRTSNPTWIKSSKSGKHNQISPSRERVNRALDEASRASLAYYRGRDLQPNVAQGRSTIAVGASEAIRLRRRSFDALIGSPPYCTRIDYAISTKPELAILNRSQGDAFDRLRASLMGTPLTNGHTPSIERARLPITRNLLREIKKHRSKASGTYYWRYYAAYFSSLWRSLDNVASFLAEGSRAALVVQDSYYKELHVDLPAIVSEMACQLGFVPNGQLDFKVSAVMANVHPHSKTYRDRTKVVEAAIFLTYEGRKGGMQ